MQLPLSKIEDVNAATSAGSAAWEVIGYGYDSQGRLTRAGVSGKEERYRFDPAGNRLPEQSRSAASGAGGMNTHWSEQVRANVGDQNFNLLRPDAQSKGQTAPGIERWQDNRIQFHNGTRYEYDAHGNRTGTWSDNEEDGVMRFFYDGNHQLVRVARTTSAQGNQSATKTATTHYRYDAFGRRIAKLHQPDTKAEVVTTYFGWDGDRMTHTETSNDVQHTVYEPGSFVPMIRLERTKGAPSLAEVVFGDSAGLQPQQIKEDLEKSFAAALRMPTEQRRAVLAISGLDVDTIEDQLQGLMGHKDQEQKDFPVKVQHYHCDHLGTPMAMTLATGNDNGQLIWAGRQDAWGRVAEEFKADGINQPIRFQGQQLDDETGMHYNRFRFYDNDLGIYITADPIGLSGGVNAFAYPKNPITFLDTYGLLPMSCDEAIKAPNDLSKEGIAGAIKREQCQSQPAPTAKNNQSFFGDVINSMKSGDGAKNAADVVPSLVGPKSPSVSPSGVGAVSGTALGVAGVALDPDVGRTAVMVPAQRRLEKCVKDGACDAGEGKARLNSLITSGNIKEFNKEIWEAYKKQQPVK